MKFDNQNYRLTDTENTGKKLLGLSILALILSAIGYFVDSKQFFFSYLLAYTFWASIGIGSLFYVMLNHLTGAVWVLVLRRITETFMMVLPYMFILFIPIIFGMHDLYHWSHEDVLLNDEILQKKSGYLNIPFFVIRTVVYFTIWFLIARKLYKTSILQDNNPTADQIQTMRKVSGPGMVLYAITTSFAAFDWLMSLDPHWYSTIFGVYFFSGCLLSAMALFTLFGLYLRKKNVLNNTVTVEHYHDLAKLMLGFTIFWAYMAFSQYFLIWYANIPEETIWYAHRWEGSWKYITLLLVVGHFLVPFAGLITRMAKRSFKLLTFMTIWLLAMHWIDLLWLIFPNFNHHGFTLSWMDITLFLGIGGLFMTLFWKHFIAHAIVPINDPELGKSIKFLNT